MIVAFRREGITGFDLPAPAGTDALPEPVKRTIHQLTREFWSIGAAQMLERMVSPKARAVWLDFAKVSRDGNKSPCYLPVNGQQHAEALQATAKLAFELCYASVLKARAEARFQAVATLLREHGWAADIRTPGAGRCGAPGQGAEGIDP